VNNRIIKYNIIFILIYILISCDKNPLGNSDYSSRDNNFHPGVSETPNTTIITENTPTSSTSAPISYSTSAPNSSLIIIGFISNSYAWVGNSTLISPSVLTNGGGAILSCTTSPTLPSGLSINNSTCVISGTPSVSTSATLYTITVTNNLGSNSVNLALSIDYISNIISQGNLAYGTSYNQSINFTLTSSRFNCNNISATSSIQSVISNSNLSIVGTAPNCSININVLANISGNTIVNLDLIDTDLGITISRNFNYYVQSFLSSNLPLYEFQRLSRSSITPTNTGTIGGSLFITSCSTSFCPGGSVFATIISNWISYSSTTTSYYALGLNSNFMNYTSPKTIAFTLRHSNASSGHLFTSGLITSSYRYCSLSYTGGNLRYSGNGCSNINLVTLSAITQIDVVVITQSGVGVTGKIYVNQNAPISATIHNLGDVYQGAYLGTDGVNYTNYLRNADIGDIYSFDYEMSASEAKGFSAVLAAWAAQ